MIKVEVKNVHNEIALILIINAWLISRTVSQATKMQNVRIK